jgi:hypothetical protein
MKGFPNQACGLPKLTTALAVVQELIEHDSNARDQVVYGEALVHAGVAGTGHAKKPVYVYLQEQRQKRSSNQSHLATARGLRELFKLLGLVEDDGETLLMTDEGEAIAAHAGEDLGPELTAMWRNAFWDMTHDGGDPTISHPYRVLRRLVVSRPGITYAKCALALEAQDDSEMELQRIVALSDRNEDDILAEIGVTKNNWNNAHKILPPIAVQLGDLIRTGNRMYPA